MPLLLCAATPFEIKPTVEWLRRERIDDVDVLLTGVGLTAATYALTESVLTKRPHFILQAGIAGGFDTARALGSVLSVRSEIIGDLGVKEDGRFRSLFDLNLLGSEDAPWRGGRLSADDTVMARAGLPAVDGVSVNEISTDAARIADWQGRGIGVESMEGAALHYVALRQNIPFLQIRSLSNFAGERDKSKWTIGAAIARLNEELQPLLLKFLTT